MKLVTVLVTVFFLIVLMLASTVQGQPRSLGQAAGPAAVFIGLGEPCQPLLADCKANYYPAWDYNASGCRAGYACVPIFESNFSALSEQFSVFLESLPGLSPEEVVNVYVYREKAAPFILSFQLDNGKVVNIALAEKEDWTLRAETTEDVLNTILASGDPATETLAAINERKISLHGRSFSKKIKLGFLMIGLKLAGIFG